MIVDVASIDHEHLAGHPLITFMPTLTMRQKAFADFFDSQLPCVGPIGPRLHLAFNANAESVSGFLGWEMFA